MCLEIQMYFSKALLNALVAFRNRWSFATAQIKKRLPERFSNE